MRSETLFAGAVEAQRRKRGVRVKVRVPTLLWADATACADSIGWPVEEWVCGVVRQHLAGKFDGVDYPREWLLGTRDGSVCAWVRVPEGFDHRGEALRVAVACAVARYMPRVPAFAPSLVEGRDYVVAGSEEW